jgi:hypothetical protein
VCYAESSAFTPDEHREIVFYPRESTRLTGGLFVVYEKYDSGGEELEVDEQVLYRGSKIFVIYQTKETKGGILQKHEVHSKPPAFTRAGLEAVALPRNENKREPQGGIRERPVKQKEQKKMRLLQMPRTLGGTGTLLDAKDHMGKLHSISPDPCTVAMFFSFCGFDIFTTGASPISSHLASSITQASPPCSVSPRPRAHL